MSNRGRRVVAVVANSFETYQRGIVESIHARVEQAGFGTLCVAGRDLNAQDAIVHDGERRIAHPLTRHLDVRGTIILSTIIGQGFSQPELARFAREISRGPVVSLGVALPGVPSVTLESEAALTALMEHMTRDPSRRRFAFLRGFADDADSRVREQAFRRVLAEKGIVVDERLVIDGHYIGADAYTAVDTLLRAGHRFDALVAANDLMAVSAVAAIERHGMAVPRDVIVSGFDDSPEAIAVQPPLTSVRHRIERQARTAAELLLAELEADGKTRPAPGTGEAPHRTVEAELVVRRSTLDDPVQAEDDEELDRAFAAPEPASALGELLARRLADVPVARGVDVEAIADGVVATLLTGRGTLPRVLEETLAAHPIDAHGRHWWWHAGRQLTHAITRVPDGLADAAALAPTSRALTSLESARAAAGAALGIEAMTHRQLQERLLIRLAGCTSREAIWALLHEGLGSIGVARAWVALYDEEPPIGALVGGEDARLVFTLGERRSPVAPERFALVDILPEPLGDELERGTLVLSPLQAGTLQLGYLLLDPGRLVTLELAALVASVALALRQVRQVSDLERRAEELRNANSALSVVARYDSLTGLPNRALFHENLEAAFERARGRDEEVALLFMDLDGFKLINDTLGHSAGDHLLRIVAARVGGVLRRGDSLSRLGGDEFTIVARQPRGSGAAVRIAEDVLEAVARPCRLGARVVDISASVGIACHPVDGADAETLIRNADTAMYHAKACGKSRHARYTPALNSEAIAELALREDLRRAIERGELHVHYQPRVTLSDGRVTGFEALLRWRRESSGASMPEAIGPARFVPVAERAGLIGALDAYSLDAACLQARRWQDAGLPVSVSVNLSVKRLQERDIVEQVVGTLRTHRLEPMRLELEVTESAAMSDVETNIEKLGALRALGVRIAIDDFGSGYSSLNHLRRLPATTLKVDRAFLAGIGRAEDADSTDGAIVRAVVGLGQSLGFRTVAEGVETDVQADFLRELACDEGQGYLFGRPLAPAAATALLVDRGPSTRAEPPRRRLL